MGEFYEKLVGIKKRALRKTLGNHCLAEKQLANIVVKVEAVVNTCPLVYNVDDINSNTVIIPSHFLSLSKQDVHFLGTYKTHYGCEITEQPARKASL